jgi:tyrosyl-tRNA synthetase
MIMNAKLRLIGEIMLQEAPDTRHAQKVLAEQVTILVHGGKINLSESKIFGSKPWQF